MVTPEILEKLCQLFFQGKKPVDAEIRELVPHAGTRNLLYRNWKGWGKPNHAPQKQEKPTTTSPGVRAKEAILPGGERVGGIDETKAPKVKMPLKTEDTEDKTEEGEEKDRTEGEGEGEKTGAKTGFSLAIEEEDARGTVKAEVIGEGLPVTVKLSIKTLALYQILRSARGDNLELGDFLDEAVEDIFRGRGKDLGLVALEVSNAAR